MSDEESHSDPVKPVSSFRTTHWTLVFQARDSGSPEGPEALEQLCRAYWFPLYAHLRRKGKNDADAKDVTQGFFAKILQNDSLTKADRAKGKFRNFLLTALNRYAADEWDKQHAQKRGGKVVFEFIDDDSSDDRFRREPVDGMDLEKAYEKEWALALLEKAGQRLQAECTARGQAEIFACLKASAEEESGAVKYAEVAQKLGLSEAGVRTAVFRARVRYSEILREEVALTVENDADVDDELRDLMRIIRS